MFAYKYMSKTTIIEISHITHVKHLGGLSEANFGKNRVSGRLTFGRKKTPNQCMEGIVEA